MYKVLIVDDEPLVRASLRAFVEWEEHGFSPPRDASNGEEALRIAREEPPDLIFLDMVMPRCDGIEFLQERSSTGEEAPIVVVLSAHGEFSLVRDAFRLGAYDYMLKADMTPDTVIDTLTRVREILGRDGEPPKRETNDDERITGQLLRDLLESGAPAEVAELLRDMGYAVQFPLTPCEFRLHDEVPVDGDASHRVHKKRTTVLEYAGSALHSAAPGLVVKRDATSLVFLLFQTTEHERAARPRAHSLCRRITELTENALNVSLSWVVGEVCHTAADIPRTITLMAGRFSTDSRVVRRAKEFIHAHFADPSLSLTAASRYAEVGRTHLSAQFSRECAMGFRDYLIGVRIEEACRLLERTTLRVQQIGEAVGFRSTEHFSRTFKRVTGYSPTYYPGRGGRGGNS